MRKSPAKNEEVGDFLAHIKKKLYFCSGIEMVAYAALQGTGPLPTTLAFLATRARLFPHPLERPLQSTYAHKTNKPKTLKL